jgi:hypothetical protein
MVRVMETLRSRAEQCRSLAAGASDPKVARALMQTAEEIEAALRIIEDGGLNG